MILVRLYSSRFKSDVRQTFIDCSGMSRGGKMDKLVEMLTEMDSNHQRTLIFVETKKLADVVAGRLSDEEKMSATSMHGDRSQEQREMALEDFRRGLSVIVFLSLLISVLRETSHPRGHLGRCQGARHQRHSSCHQLRDAERG